MTRIWWCEEHNAAFNWRNHEPEFGPKCDAYRLIVYPGRGTGMNPCRMVEAILVTSPDSIIIERENGEWPEEARSVLNKAIYQWFEDGRGVTVSFEADLALDSLAEWSQSPATDVATND